MGDQVAVNYLHAFLERHPTHTYERGEIILFQGEAPRVAFAIKHGTVKAYNLSVNGDEKPVAFYSEDEIIPSAWVYGRLPISLYFYEALTPEVEVYLIKRQEFLDFIKHRPQLLYQELEKVLADQLGASIRLNALQHSRATDKLIYTLHYLAITHGQAHKDGRITITLSLTHQDFANLTGLTRETVATELNRLKRNKIIDYTKNSPYQLDLNKLNKLLNDQFIADLKLN